MILECLEGCVRQSRGQVNKSLTIHALQSCRLAPANSCTNQLNAKSLGLPYFVRYPAIIYVIYQRKKVQYFSNKNVITFVRAEKGKKVDWAQIIFNNLCSKLDRLSQPHFGQV
jgi:hypothetical protein